MSKEDLPSIDDLVNSDLPSVEDFITEENAEELPSVQDFIVEEKEEEIVETVEEVEEQIDLTEVIRLINDVRKDIPDIPEVKYYDQELEQLSEKISSLPEVKYYDKEVEAICEQIDLVREQVKDLPEVKYYDEQVDAIEDRIDSLQTDVTNLPEVKYYDSEIEAICEAIDAVKASIPKFPKWVNEVNEVPDFSWIGKTFSVIDDDFIKVNDAIDTLQENVVIELKKISEENTVTHFENRVQFGTEVKDLDTKLEEEKGKIWKELRSSSMKIWEYHKTFKDDDRKLKKQILGEYNSLKQNINKELKEINYTSTKTDELLLKYFTELREEISGLPEVKYYDKDIDYVKSDIKGLYKIVEDIKSSQKQLQEDQKLLAETNVPLGEDPPDTKNSDPLTPLDQKFVTLDQLQKHYRQFVERVQYQLGSIGGGGAGFIHDLDDVQVGSAVTNGSLLIYNSSIKKYIGIASTALGGGSASELAEDATGTNLTLSGNLVVAGIATYEDVKHVDSLGFSTFRSGLEVRTGTATTALLVQGDARVTGILTVGTSSITLDGSDNSINVGTAITISGSTGKIEASEIRTVGTSGAFYPACLTTTQRDALTVTEGAMIFNKTSKKLEFYDGTSWISLPGMSLGLTVALDG